MKSPEFLKRVFGYDDIESWNINSYTFFLCVFITIPLLTCPKFYCKVCKFIRRRIFWCCIYYDPEARVDDRSELMLFAMIKGKSKAVIKNDF